MAGLKAVEVLSLEEAEQLESLCVAGFGRIVTRRAELAHEEERGRQQQLNALHAQVAALQAQLGVGGASAEAPTTRRL